MSDSPLDEYREQIEALAAEGCCNADIVRRMSYEYGISTSRDSVRRAKKRWETPAVQPKGAGETAGTHITADKATLVSRESTLATMSPEELMAESGLLAENWNFHTTRNSWEALIGNGQVVTLHQLKVVCTRKPEAILRDLTVQSDWKPRPARKRKPQPVSHRVILPDPHAPLYEEVLMDASVALIGELQPSHILSLGDNSDNSPWSRHKPNPRFKISAEEALWKTYDVMANWRNAAPDAEMETLWGNHDHWLLDRIKEQYPELVALRRPYEEAPYLSLGKLLKLDELRIKYSDSVGEYHDNVVEIHPDLVGLHGTKTGKHGGAILEIDGWEGASIIQGHDHKTAIIAVNKRLPNGGHTQRYAISAGTMAQRDLGYDPKQNVSQSFVVITEWGDGRWHPELVLYDPVRKDVTWREWRYSG